MRIAIFNQHLDTGGVETFLLSLVAALQRLGHEVHVWLLEAGAGRPQALMPDMQALNVPIGDIRQLDRQPVPPTYDVALATNPATLFALLRAATRGRITTGKLLAGVYQTRMFCLPRGPLNLHNRLTRRVFAGLPPQNAIFGNAACRDEHARAIPAMAAAPVVPLIVDTARFARRPPWRPQAALRIVSIGRLEAFKSYNLSMPDVVARLHGSGHPVEWHVYGTGPLHDAMVRKADSLGLGRHVRLHGSIGYGDTPAVLADAFAFVGSGLGLMEAAACGVPALAAIEYSPSPQTFGFVSSIEGGSFFEPNLARPRGDIGDALLDLIARQAAAPDAYERLGDACRARMAPFEAAAVARAYMAAFEAASPSHPRLGLARDTVYNVSARVHRAGAGLLRQRTWRTAGARP